MKSNTKIKPFVLATFALIFLALFIGTSRFILVKEDTKNEVFIPAQSQYAIKVQGKELFKTSLHDLFLDKPDVEVFGLLRKLIEKQTDNQKIKDFGINFLSDVVMFNYHTTEGEFYGFVFQLGNSIAFQRNILDEISKNTGGVCNTETGILLIFNPKKKNSIISKESIQKEALQILNNPRRKSFFTKINFKNNSLIYLEKHSELTDFQYFGKGNLSLDIKDSVLNIAGKFSSAPTVSKSNWTLKPQGFHISSSMLNAEIQDTIQYLFTKQGFNLPKTTKVAFNYSGIQMGNGGFIPKMDLLLEFDSTISKTEFLEPQHWRKLGFTISRNTDNEYDLNNGSNDFLLTFLDDRTIFIGPNKENLVNKSNDRIFYMTGDARYLTKIDGGGLVAMGINLYPPFKTGKDFLESLKKTDIEITSNGKNTVIKGEISFKEGRSVMVETLRLMLRVNEF
jgi:hypothetical protein